MRRFNCVKTETMFLSRHIICFFAIILFCGGCTEHDLRTPAVKVVVHDNINIGKNVATWAYLTDDNGIVFDVQQLSNNSTTQLMAVDHAAKLNLTILSVIKDFQMEYGFRTFSNLTRGQEFHLHEYQPKIQEPIGTARFTINNYAEPTEYIDGIIFASRDGVNQSSQTRNANTYSSTLTLYTFPQDILISSYRNGIPVYWLVRNVMSNSEVILDFNEFTPAETTFQFDKWTLVLLGGFENDVTTEGYSIATHSIVEKPPTGPFVIGYPKIFSRFYSRIYMSHNGMSYQVERHGTPLTSLELPDFTYKIENSGIADFKVSVSENVTHKCGQWSNTKNSSWQVYSSGNGTSVIKTIPDELRRRYKDIGNMSDFQLMTLTLFQHHSGDYDGWLTSKFGEQRVTSFQEISTRIQVH